MSVIETERLSKQFWAITENWEVRCVTGYECPANDGVWWVPTLGYSMTEGYHLFDGFDEAKRKALGDLATEINKLKLAYNQLLDMKEQLPQ